MNTRLIRITVVVGALIPILAAVFLVKQLSIYWRNSVAVTQKEPEHPSLSVFLGSDKKIIQKGETVTVTVNARSPHPILAIDTYLAYESSFLRFQKATPGNYFEKPMIFSKDVNPSKGTIFYALGSLTPKNNTGIITTLSFVAKKSGKTTISIAPQTLASMHGGAKKADIVRGKPIEITIQ